MAPEGVEWAVAVGNRNFLIHQYDEINRELTWLTLSVDLPAWRLSLQSHFEAADAGARVVVVTRSTERNRLAGRKSPKPPRLHLAGAAGSV